MESSSPLTLFQMTGINVNDYPNSLEINQLLWRNRDRLRVAYLRDQRYASIGEAANKPGHCLWNGCTQSRKATHVHLHHADSGTCEWDWCSKHELHIHKYKPLSIEPVEDIDPSGRYDSVNDILNEVLGDQYVVQTEWRSGYEQAELINAAEEADKERRRKRLEEAERAGEEAARKHEERVAARRVLKAEQKRREEEARETKRRRIAGRISMRRELQGGNELERHFDEAEITPRQLIRDEELEALEVPCSPRERTPPIEPERSSPLVQDGKGPSDVALGKRKRSPSLISISSPSDSGDDHSDHTVPPYNAGGSRESGMSELTMLDADELDELIWQAKAELSPKSETSTLTRYSLEELDAILEGAEVIVEVPEQELPRHYVFSKLLPKASVGSRIPQEQVPETPPAVQIDTEPSDGEFGELTTAAQCPPDIDDSVTEDDDPIVIDYEEDKENWHEENGVLRRLGPTPATAPNPNISVPPELQGDPVDGWMRAVQIQGVMRDFRRPWRERRQWRFKIFEDP